MNNNLLLLFASSLVLFSCKKEEKPQTVDLLSTPLESTAYGFTGSIGDNYYYLSDSVSYSNINAGPLTGNKYYYVIRNVFVVKSINAKLYSTLSYLISDDEFVDDSQFYNFFRVGKYNMYDSIEFPLDTLTVHARILSQIGTYPDWWGSNLNENTNTNYYYDIIDTLHTRFNNHAAIKYRARIRCILFKKPDSDTQKLFDGTIVGLFVKP